jgi:hypothetical protein
MRALPAARAGFSAATGAAAASLAGATAAAGVFMLTLVVKPAHRQRRQRGPSPMDRHRAADTQVVNGSGAATATMALLPHPR